MSIERSNLIKGVCAAVLSPRNSDDTVDVPLLQRLILFLLSKGIRTFAVNGATGEYCLTTAADLRALLKGIYDVAGAQAEILCGIGAASEYSAISLARIAEEEGAMGLLLPPPFFFPYAQDDVALFCSSVARSTSLPIVLYNLPQFTTGISSETALSLLSSHPTIVGIKDSSGSIAILRDLRLLYPSGSRIVGNDGVLAQAIGEDVCDAVISGVACAFPELISGIFHAGKRGARRDLQLLNVQLLELIDRLDAFPTPWGLKWMLQARNVIPATFSQPLSKRRLEQSVTFMSWFDGHIRSTASIINSAEGFTNDPDKA